MGLLVSNREVVYTFGSTREAASAMRPLPTSARGGACGGRLANGQQARHPNSGSGGPVIRRGRDSGHQQQARPCALPGSSGSSGSARGRSPQRPAAASPQVQEAAAAAAHLAPEQHADGSEAGRPASPPASLSTSMGSYDELTFAPEDFELPPGVLSEVDRGSPPSPDDVFRCPGCTRPECMVRGWGGAGWGKGDELCVRVWCVARVRARACAVCERWRAFVRAVSSAC
jgi:hypothetical protein